MSGRKLAAALWLLVPLLAAPLAAQDWAGRGRINGSVQSESQQPIAGARVTLHPADRPDAGPEPVTTDDKGRWSYLGLTSGSWVVVVEAEGFFPKNQAVLVNEFGSPATSVVQLEPNPMGAVNKGNALFDAGDLGGARAEYEKALDSLAPEQRAALRSRIADTHFEQGDFAAARPIYEQALAGLPPGQQVHVLLRLAETHSRLGDNATALTYYDRSVELLPAQDQARILMTVAQLHDQNGARDRAITTLERAHGLDAANPAVLQLLADLLNQVGREDEARAYLEKLPEDAALPADMVLNFGIEKYNEGDLEGAFEYFERARKQNPDLPEVYYYRGLALLGQGSNDEARADFERFLELAPDAPQAKEAREFLQFLGGGG